MKRVVRALLALSSMVIFLVAADAEEIRIDLSRSTFEMTEDNNLKIFNVDVTASGLGINGKYWAELQWDPVDYVFTPVRYGKELVTSPSEDISGTYSLKGVYIKYSNGQTLTDKAVKVSGTLRMGADTYSQSMVLNNKLSSSGGIYDITFTSGTREGLLHRSSYLGEIDSVFWITGNVVTVYSSVPEGNGLTTQEIHYWTKVSDSIDE